MTSLPKPKKPISERTTPLMLDPDAASALTALMAVRDGLASETQIEEAVREQVKRTGQPGIMRPTLASVLVEKGVLDEKQVKALEKRLDPEILPGYRILGEVGRGGMGTVFRARQISMDRIVAVKILANRLSK